jgi:hypothetical protein
VDAVFAAGNEKSTSLEMYRTARNFVTFCWRQRKDVERLEAICRKLVSSLVLVI